MKKTALTLSLSVLFCVSAFAAQAGKTNIILIMADDMGYETVTANGGESYQTPNIDRLAKMGTRFEHCYAQPICTPSRVKIMTGRYNVRNYEKFGVFPKGETTFANLFREAGYKTAIAGKWQLGTEKSLPGELGFDEALLWQHYRKRVEKIGGKQHDTRYENPNFEYNGKELDYDNGEYGPDVLTDFICDFLEKNKDEPFMVYYPMLLTHCPFTPTPDSKAWNPESPGSPSYKGDAKYFGDMVAHVDQVVGQIAAKVESLGLSENTIIIFTGDNGTDRPVVSKFQGREVAGAKGSTTDAGTRVTLVAHGAEVESQVIQDLVDFSDFFPTVCDIAGIKIPDQIELDGRSFFPQLRGEKGDPREWIYCWYSSKGNNDKARVFARTQRYKLYRNGNFFDIQNDFDEKRPINNPEEKDIRQKLQAVIDQYEVYR